MTPSAGSDVPVEERVAWVLEWLKTRGTLLGHDHALALALWKTGWYEARMLTSFVADPAMVSAEQMDRWCKDIDNWAYCDTLSYCPLGGRGRAPAIATSVGL